MRKSVPLFDKDAQISRAFKREFGVDMKSFKMRYPTYDDFLLHKLTGKNYPHVVRREPEDVPQEGRTAIKELDDLKKYFTGPLDVINGAMENAPSKEPDNLKKNSGRSDKPKLTPFEIAKLKKAIKEFKDELLEEEIRKKILSTDPYGYEEYREKERERREYIKKEADEYRKEYENTDDEDVPSDYLNN